MVNKQTLKTQVLNCGSKLLDLSRPVVMGILNVTPDSFYDGGSYPSVGDQLKQAEKMLKEGASIIDIGAVSTRPGSKPVDEKEELTRLLPVLSVISKYFPACIISVDTFRSPVAAMAIENGAGMINDIYGGRFDERMFETVASHHIPYVMMHMQGTPQTMQIDPQYTDVVKDITGFFTEQLAKFPSSFNQVILDPGFGFGKKMDHNFRILARLREFKSLGYPLMAGFSRKSMINKALHTKPIDALNGTTILNTIALLKGADILRVHDVKEAMEVVKLVTMTGD
jgi:dihydropteroate synthase